MSNDNFEQKLRNEIGQLDKDRQPQRDLWTGIELAISKEPAKKNKPYLAVAAALVVMGFVGWMSIQPGGPQNDPQQLVAALSQQHQQQMKGLLVSFADQPALTTNWQQQLNELDEAAEAVKKALQQDPDNPALLKMLQQVYQQQIDLIEKVHAPGWQRI
ncbi:hypothetical protein [Neptunicella sp. SCSIO 80796]|uniref:hypothetical protein n=1 Tax=Neptunicella plasticusilytica TaxID=3117012 RepID=UPI003A4DA78E